MADCRLARPDDLSQLLGLYRHLHPGEPPPDETAARNSWAAMLESALVDVVVADAADGLAASCVLVVVPNLTRGGRPFAVIENVVTHPMHRRHGHGRAVLAYACARAWERDCYKVMLMTGRSDEGVLGFYEAAGFERGTKTCFEQRRL